MDPVSLTTSAVALAAVATRVCTAIASLRSLCRNLPGRIHAVSNEVADFELVLLQLTTLMESRTALPESKYSAIPHLLKQARANLAELESIVNKLIRVRQNSRTPISIVKAWRHEQMRLRELQDDIRSVKSSLNILLGASNSDDMLKIRLDIQEIFTATDCASESQAVISNKVLMTLAGVDERIARVELMLQHQSELIRTNQFVQVQSAYGTSTPRKTTQSVAKPYGSPQSGEKASIGIRVTPSRISCRRACRCACHSHRSSSSPAFMNNLLGRLFVGYSGLPVIAPSCDSPDCRGSKSSQLSLEYWFPTSFWSRMVRMELSYHHMNGPSVQLDMLRIIPDDAQCINFAIGGNINGLQHLFNSGLASARDISTTRGYSLLRWALYSKQYKTCKFLLQAGADVDYRPIGNFDNSPRIKACHFLLEGNLPEGAVEALRAITKRSEYLDDFIDDSSFTQTHRIILGLSSRDLEEELLTNPHEIDAQDSMGRTALAWAAARNDRHAIVTLLRYRADPNIIDVQISGPLSNAAAQGHTACVKLLLDAGASPDLPLPRGIKKGGPLNVAARNSKDPVLVKILLDFGANVDQCGVDGKTALFYAAQKDDASLAILLLENGATINIASKTGDTPLTTAITHNSHNVLKLFLERWHEYSVCPRLQGPHLLRISALYADVETIDILENTNHFRLKYDDKYASGDFAEVLRAREDATDKLAFVFDELLQVLQGPPTCYNSVEDALEAGNMGYTFSRAATWETTLSSGEFSDEYKSNADSEECFYDAVADLTERDLMANCNVQGVRTWSLPMK